MMINCPMNFKINRMKTMILSGLMLMFMSNLNAQMVIGKANANGASALLDFDGNTATEASTDQETTNYKGIILPAVDAEPSYSVITPTTDNPNNGTFIYDLSNQSVKMFQNGAWVTMTSEGGNITDVVLNPSAEDGDGVIIGDDSSSAEGVLILESADKALILPQVKNPHLTVKGAYPGMMCYDTVSNSIAVYDGTVWSYWR